MHLYATILDYMGIDGNISNGHSLRPLIEGESSDKFDFVVTEWNYNLKDNEPNYMLVKGDWKWLIAYTSDSQVVDALYNLKDDPWEMNNLLGNNPGKAKYQDQANELKNDLLRWLEAHHSTHYDGVKERIL